MWRGGPLMCVEFGSVDYYELLRKSLLHGVRHFAVVRF
jgi:hypothetical protein